MRRYRFKALLFTCVSFVIPLAPAAENISLREQFIQAEKLVWKSKSTEFKQAYQALDGYALQPYIEQKRLLNNIRLSSAEDIRAFLDTYEGTPLDAPVRQRWLRYLAKRKKAALFTEFYRPTSDDALTCHYYLYKLEQGDDPKDILPKVTRLWLVGKSQPKVCDPLFSQWQKAGFRTPEIVWRRLEKAADGGKHTLIPYLTSLLPKEEQYLGRLWHKVRKDPAYIAKMKRFPNKSAKELQIFTYGVKRFVWRDPDRALYVFRLGKKHFAFDNDVEQEIAARFALALASKNHSKATEWLANVEHQRLSDLVVQWRIADLLRSQDWPFIKSELIKLPDHHKEKHQWRYWYARSLIETNEAFEGRRVMAELAKTRHYYGFLAASQLNQPISLQNKPLTISDEERKLVENTLTGQRAFELFALNRTHHARQEWNYWMTTLSVRERLVAAKLANEQGWYDRAIFGLSQVGYLDDVDLRFPLAYQEEITKHAKKYDINPAWAFAISRRESSFMADAHSSAGAKGLMQVMPGTAKTLTNRRITNKYLTNEANNINLGTKYLSKLWQRHDGNLILATAAYNAGPHRVKQWLKSLDKNERLPADIWIETIPFRETRDYVKSVMAYQQIYLYKVGQEASLFDELISLDISSL